MEEGEVIQPTDNKIKLSTNENEEEENSKTQKIIIVCEMCKLNEFKYKCPRCLLKTCCLNCVKQHKKKYSCSGQKDKFNKTVTCEKDLLKDMRFLNEALRDSNNSSKKVFHMTDNEEKKDREKKNKYNKKCAKKFRNINLMCSPMIMQRFSENHSYVDHKNRKFFWTIKFIFITELNEKFEHIFGKTFDDTETSLSDIIKYFKENKQELNLNLLRFLNLLEEQVLENCSILYRVNIKENNIKGKIVKLNKLIYEECDKTLLLKDVLEGKDVLEYPEFLVLLNKNKVN